MQDDMSLAKGLNKRDPEAWAKLYEEYFSKIYRYIAFRVSTRTEAEDLAGEVFLRALEAGPSFRWRGAPISAWLFRIARNLIIDYRRTDKAGRTVPLEDVVIQGEEDPEDVVQQRSDIGRAIAAVRDLSGAQREVIELRFGGELSTKEVARVLGKNEGTIRVLQHNALAALRRKLVTEDDNG